MANPISEHTKTASLKIAKGIQKPGQTKEQTKIISQGIEKGITLYKQQQKAKARAADKQRKLEFKVKQKTNASVIVETGKGGTEHRISRYFPWVLLGLSWAGFIGFYILTIDRA